jgi:hypothetical protein
MYRYTEYRDHPNPRAYLQISWRHLRPGTAAGSDDEAIVCRDSTCSYRFPTVTHLVPFSLLCSYHHTHTHTRETDSYSVRAIPRKQTIINQEKCLEIFRLSFMGSKNISMEKGRSSKQGGKK